MTKKLVRRTDFVDLNIKTRIPTALKNALDDYCGAEGISIAEVTRSGIKMYLESKRPTVMMPSENDFSEAIVQVGKVANALSVLAKLGSKE